MATDGVSIRVTAPRKPTAAKAKKVAETSPIATGRQPARAALPPFPAVRNTPTVASAIAPTSLTVGVSPRNSSA